MFATIRGGFVYLGIQISSGDGALQCSYDEQGTSGFLPFPFGGKSTFYDNYAECLMSALTVQRNLANAIILLLYGEKYYVTDEVSRRSVSSG